MKNYRDFAYGNAEIVEWTHSFFHEAMSKRLNKIAEEWVEQNEDDRCFNENGSSQSVSHYWIMQDDNTGFKFCIRMSDHEPVACVSRVDININLMDYTQIEEDECGYSADDEWFIDEDAVIAAIEQAVADAKAKMESANA